MNRKFVKTFGIQVKCVEERGFKIYGKNLFYTLVINTIK